MDCRGREVYWKKFVIYVTKILFKPLKLTLTSLGVQDPYYLQIQDLFLFLFPFDPSFFKNKRVTSLNPC